MTPDISFHLHLFNARDPQCPHCHSNSSLFEIAQPGSGTSGDSNGSGGGTAPTDSGTHATPSQTKLPLGMGLGLGLPLLVLLTASAAWMYRRRKNKAGKDDGSQTAVPLVDRKAAESTQESGKTEMQGHDLVELSTLEPVVEAPNIVRRAELEGDDGR